MSKILPGIMFWGWNAVFILFVALLMFSGLAPAIFLAALGGDIPISFVFSILLLIAIPILAIVLAARQQDRDGAFLMKFFFALAAGQDIAIGEKRLFKNSIIAADLIHPKHMFLQRKSIRNKISF